MKAIFRFLAELSGDVETQETESGAIVKQVTYK